MIEKIKSVYRFKSAHEVTDTLNSLNSNVRPYQYAFLDPETNPLMVELRKMNNKIEAIVERIDAIEKGQKNIMDAINSVCSNQSNLRQVNSTQPQRGRSSDYHS